MDNNHALYIMEAGIIKLTQCIDRRVEIVTSTQWMLCANQG